MLFQATMSTMARAGFLRTCFFLVLAMQLGPASSQVPSNYLPLDQSETGNANSVRASTYQESPRAAVRTQAVDAQELSALAEDTVQDAEQEDEDVGQENASDQPLEGVTATAEGIPLPQGAIVALGSDPLRAYTSRDYPSITRSSIQKVKDTQAEYAESLASTDIINMLGRPFLHMAQGSGRCADGQSGQFDTYYYLIREGLFPKSMALVRFCADGMQSITTQKVP